MIYKHLKILSNTILFGLLVFCVEKISAQETQNYIIEKTYLNESGTDKNISVNYFDGLGRPIQSIQVGASPTGKDMVQHITYDSLGRESKKFLPYTSESTGGFFRDSAESELVKFYNNQLTTSTNVKADNDPWSVIEFEESPLNRVLQQGAPGSSWQPVKGSDEDHAVHFDYETNTPDEVIKLFSVDENNNLVVEGNYNDATLYKTGTRDENKVWSYEYKNMLGKVILKVSDPTGLKLQTYYVYDDYGLLRYVIPPKAMELIGKSTGNISTDIIKNLCYYYQYDGRKRMAEKKLPGAQPVYMVYDKRDRLVLTQDGNLRTGNKWMFTKYDALNRPVIKGIYDYGDTICQANMQNIVNDQMTIFFENEREGYNEVDSCFGYTNNSFPVLDGNDEILTVTYYDNYDFDSDNSLQDYCKSEENTDYPLSIINNQVKGQVTGSKTRILGTDDFITTLVLYDDKYRPIRSYSEDPLLSKSDLVLTKYDFTGNVLKTWQIHDKDFPNNDTIHIKQRFEYDHAMRLVNEYHKVSSNPEILITHNEYNELGQLIQKDLHETTGGNYLQSVDYQYNIRGWLTKINDPDNLQQTGQAKDLFAMELAYSNPTFGLNSAGKAQFNGNISAMRWTDDYYNDMSAYVFDYDHVNRLQKADYQKYVTSTWNNPLDFDLDTVNYDANGNITELKRYRDTLTLMDDLQYSYYGTNNSNQLLAVTDNGELDKGFIDTDNAIDYEYDANGNMVKDLNKGIDTIEYNCLNLPQNIIGGNDTISYFYTADGTKIAKINKDRIIKQYIGNVVYDEDHLDYITTSEGMVKVANENTFTYEYYLKDHLGNTRVAFDESGSLASLTQVNHYYPFGMNISAYAFSSQTDNKYKFGGKELQDDQLAGRSLNIYDFEARMYDPVLGRFTTQDPHAESYFSLSPYNYSANNPILFIDPTGEDILFYIWEQKGDEWQRKQVQYNQLDKTLQKALEAFAKTDAGFSFLKDFANKGDKIGSVEFSETGKNAKHDMEIAQFDSRYSAYGTSDFRESKSNIVFDMKINLARTDDDNNAESMAVTIGHEAFIHFEQYKDKLMNAYDKKDFSTVDKIREQRWKIAADRNGGADHDGYILGNQKYAMMRTFITQLKTILNPAQVNKQIKEHDDLFKKQLKH